MRKPRLLLTAPTTSYRLDDFMAAARHLDVEILLASNRCRKLAALWPDLRSIPLPFSSPKRAVEQAMALLREQPVDAVLPVDDEATFLAAMLARKLKLPGNDPKSTALSRNKFLFRREIARSGMLSPRYWLLPVDTAPEHAVASKKISLPCVLKPLALSGSRGVIRANNDTEFVAAFHRIAALLSQKEFTHKPKRAHQFILAETYIQGEEFALEGLLTNGMLDILTIFDKPDPLEGPFFEETIYLTPSGLPPEIQVQLHRSIENACHVIGLRHGPVHAEVRINASGIYVIEMAARTIGVLCAQTIRLSTDNSLEEMVIQHALGRPAIPANSPLRASGVMMIPIPKQGILHGVQGIEAAKAVPGIEDVEITIKEGHLVIPLPDSKSYLGFIFAHGRTTRDVERSLRKAHACLSFSIKPSLGVM